MLYTSYTLVSLLWMVVHREAITAKFCLYMRISWGKPTFTKFRITTNIKVLDKVSVFIFTQTLNLSSEGRVLDYELTWVRFMGGSGHFFVIWSWKSFCGHSHCTTALAFTEVITYNRWKFISYVTFCIITNVDCVPTYGILNFTSCKKWCRLCPYLR